MDIEHYRRRLLEEQARLVELTGRTKAREATPDPIHDRTDTNVLDELKDELFKEAESHWTTLRRVRAAVQRIEDGTYGRCLADDEPIEPSRLEAGSLGRALPAARAGAGAVRRYEDSWPLRPGTQPVLCDERAAQVAVISRS
jgi:RNA polymerase-binding transcription factor DksA